MNRHEQHPRAATAEVQAVTGVPHWPLDKIAARLAALKRHHRATGTPPPGTALVLLMTGALNPVHRGHTGSLRHIAERVERTTGLPVVGAFLSPSSDCYLRGKFASPAATTLGNSAPPPPHQFYFRAAARHNLCVCATRDDDLIAVGGFEVSHADRWPDYPEVCLDLQGHLAGQAADLWARCDAVAVEGTTTTTTTDQTQPQSQQQAPKLEVVFCCGSDLYVASSMTGADAFTGPDFARVAVTVRAGDEACMTFASDASIAASAAKRSGQSTTAEAAVSATTKKGSSSSSLPPPSEQRKFAFAPLGGSLGGMNSTKMREALVVLTGGMDPATMQAALSLMM